MHRHKLSHEGSKHNLSRWMLLMLMSTLGCKLELDLQMHHCMHAYMCMFTLPKTLVRVEKCGASCTSLPLCKQNDYNGCIEMSQVLEFKEGYLIVCKRMPACRYPPRICCYCCKVTPQQHEDLHKFAYASQFRQAICPESSETNVSEAHSPGY